ncbi:unnamed protein product [Amoebophrya sp. A25]|nr:unnamed protein product [Amoebophrya sp. A25]|eukprot:GSA25T00026527001.1
MSDLNPLATIFVPGLGGAWIPGPLLEASAGGGRLPKGSKGPPPPPSSCLRVPYRPSTCWPLAAAAVCRAWKASEGGKRRKAEPPEPCGLYPPGPWSSACWLLPRIC